MMMMMSMPNSYGELLTFKKNRNPGRRGLLAAVVGSACDFISLSELIDCLKPQLLESGD